MNDLYSPILHDQTRILYLPRRTAAGPEDLIECFLYKAEILHPAFNGLGLRTEDGKDDRTIKFNALSYVWGSPEKTASMICNGLTVPITPTLHGALAVIRTLEFGSEFIWADQVCINQNDAVEKSIQVQHMMEIYELATKTISWLGDPKEHLEAVKLATAWDIQDIQKQGESKDLSLVTTGADWIYSTPYFRRLWVQQEVFASRSLRFLCGSYEFGRFPLLQPQLINRRIPIEEVEIEVSKPSRFFRRKPKREIHRVIKGEYTRLSQLMTTKGDHLRCYNYFSTGQYTDIVECLLGMDNVDATNPLYFVYGVLGISRFPSKQMSVAKWANLDQREAILPIDYTIDIKLLWCILSRMLLFRCGLNLLAKFKIIHRNEPEREELELPSWAIDWRLASRFFGYHTSRPELAIKMKNAWDGVILEKTKTSRGFDRHNYKLRTRTKAPAYHDTFCAFNFKEKQDDFTKLNLFGHMVKRSFVRITEHTVELKGLKEKTPLATWHVAPSLQQDDIAVSINGFSDDRHIDGKSPRLWLLRPVKDDHFKLISCLPIFSPPGLDRPEGVYYPQLYSKSDIYIFRTFTPPELFDVWLLLERNLENAPEYSPVMAKPDIKCYTLRGDRYDEIFEPLDMFVVV